MAPTRTSSGAYWSPCSVLINLHPLPPPGEPFCSFPAGVTVGPLSSPHNFHFDFPCLRVSKIISKPLRQVNSGQIRMTFAKTHQKVAEDFLKYSNIDSLQRKFNGHQPILNHENIWIMHCSHFCCLPDIHAPVLKRSEAIFLASSLLEVFLGCICPCKTLKGPGH